MHSRRHSIVDGVRLNPLSGRISGEGPNQGYGKYNWEYRNFNRGFGRGPPKPYPPPPKPPRKDDIFMEAGRLAAEYLASQGLLPPNLLPGKWQNGNPKGHQMGNFQEFRLQVQENPMLSSEGRNSSFGQVDNVFLEGGSARRRFPDDFSSMGRRNQMRGKRRMGSFRGHDSDWVRENGRKRHCSEKTRTLPDMLEGGDDSVGVSYQGEPHVGLDVGGRDSKIITHEMMLKSEIVGNLESKLETYEFPDDADSKASSSCIRRDIPPKMDTELCKGLDDADIQNSETKEANDNKFGDRIEKEIAAENFEKQHCLVEDEPLSKHGSDLLQFCSFAKVPTKTRSSLLSSRLSRVGQGSSTTTEERNGSDTAPSSRSKVHMEEDSVEASTVSLKSSASDISRVHSARSLDEVLNVDATFAAQREDDARSHSLSDGSSSIHQEDSSDVPPGFVTCKSFVLLYRDDSSHHVGTSKVDKKPTESPSRSKVLREEDSVEASIHSIKNPICDISRVQSVHSLEDAVDSDATFVAGTERCSMSQSYSDVSLSIHQEDASDGPPGFVRCKSMVLPNKADISAHRVGTWEADKIPEESPRRFKVPGEEDISRVHSLRSSDKAVNLGATFVVETEGHRRSLSFSDVASCMHPENGGDGPPGFVRSESVVLSNRSDSSAHHLGTWEADKRLGESPGGSKVPREEDISRGHSIRSLDEAVDLDATLVAEKERCRRSQPFPDASSSVHQEDASDGPPGFVSCKSEVLHNKDDSSVHHVGTWEADQRLGKSSKESEVPWEEVISRVHSPRSLDAAVDLGVTFVAETERRRRSRSFSDMPSSIHQEDASDGPLGSVRCNSVVLPNKGDSSAHHVRTWVADKRLGESPSESNVPREEDSVQASIQSTKNLSSDVSRVHLVRSSVDAVDLETTFLAKAERHKGSESFSDVSSLMHQEHASDGPSGFARCKSMVLPNEGDSSAHNVGAWEADRRPGESPSGSRVLSEEGSVQAYIHGVENPASDISGVHLVSSMDESVVLDATCVAERERCTRSQSFMDGSSFMHQEELSNGPLGFVRSKSPVLLSKGNSSDHFVGTWEEIKRHRDSPNGSKGPREEDEDYVEASIHSTKHKKSDTSRVHSAQSLNGDVDLDATFVSEKESLGRSNSFSDGSPFMRREESSDGLLVFGRHNAMVRPNNGDNFVRHFGTWETSKRPRESPLPEILNADEDLLLHNLRAKQLCLLEEERLSPDEKMIESMDRKMVVEGSLVPKSEAGSKIAANEEKHRLPNLFKICDLNLIDASEIARSPDDLTQDHVSSASSPSGVEKEAARDVVLSMISNNLSGFDDYHGLVSDAKEAIGVDVANNSLIKEKTIATTGQKAETMYSGLDNFLNHTDNTLDLPDMQDGYGNAISRLLGTDMSNCPSVPSDIDDLHAQISLHGQEGIPADDDSIYLSFGDIPMSILGVWDQPQDYGKRF